MSTAILTRPTVEHTEFFVVECPRGVHFDSHDAYLLAVESAGDQHLTLTRVWWENPEGKSVPWNDERVVTAKWRYERYTEEEMS